MSLWHTLVNFLIMLTALGALMGIGAASAASAGVSGLINSSFNNSFVENMRLMEHQFQLNAIAQNAQNQFQTAMTNRQENFQRELISDERAYQDPSQQVQRLMNAGINPLSAMSSGGSSGAALSAAPAGVPSVGSALGVGLGHANPTVPGSLDFFKGIETLLKSRMIDIEKKRAEAQNALDFTNIDKIKADTQSILDGTKRANEMFSFELVEKSMALDKMDVDTENARVLRQNIRVQSQAMLMNSQKIYMDYLQKGIELEERRFGNDIQAKGLEVEAKESQARIANMSLSQLISFADRFSDTFSVTNGLTSGSNWNVKAAGSVEGSTPTLSAPVGKLEGEASLEGGYGSYSGESSGSSVLHREIRKDTLDPINASLRLLKELRDNPANASVARALTKLSSYLNATSTYAFRNLMMLQGQIQAVSNSIYNPTGTDSYK